MAYTGGYYTGYHKAYPQNLTKLLEREFGEEHVSYAFHLKHKMCEREPNNAFKNDQCPKNPNCFLSLGEEEREKKKEEDLLVKRLGPNPNTLLKGETDRFVGLKVRSLPRREGGLILFLSFFLSFFADSTIFVALCFSRIWVQLAT